MIKPEDKVFYRNYKWEYPKIVRGKGVFLYEDSGREYLDACSGAVSANIGHGNEEVAEAMANQAKTLAFTHLSRFTTDPIIDLAQKVVDFSGNKFSGVYFVSGGSEAADTAIKLARQYFLERDKVSCKYKVISRWRSYHGNTIGAMSLSGKTGLRRKYNPLLLEFPHIEPCYCYRCPYDDTYPQCGVKCAYALEKEIVRVGAENVSAFIAEPIVGSALSAACPPPEYFKIIREICSYYDILLIFDEVMTGFGRSGKNFAMEYWDVNPDMVMLAKGISCCYSPLGGVMVTKSIMDTFIKGSGRFIHGYTYGGNPLSCAVGAKVLEILVRDKVVENSYLQGEYLLKKLNELAVRSPIIGDVRGKGLLIGIEIVQNKETKEPFPIEKNVNGLITKIGLQNGIVLYPGDGVVLERFGDHVLVAPPLNIKRDEIDLLYSRFETTIQLVEKMLN